MPLTGASIPGFTDNPNLVAALQIVANDDEEAKWVIDLFGGLDNFISVNPGRMRIEVEQERKRIVTEWNSRPGQAKQLDTDKLSSLEPVNFSMKLGFPLDDAKLEDMRVVMPGEPSVIINDIQSAAREWVMRQMERRTRTIVRSYAALLVQMLSKTTLAYTMDGVAVSTPNAWLPTASRLTAAASWKTTTTNLIHEFDRAKTAFRKQAGGPPTHIIVGPTFAQDCLAKNEFLLDFISYNPAFLATPLNFANLLGAADMVRATQAQPNLEVHVCELYDEAGTEQWNSEFMLLARNPRAALRQYSPRTLDSNWTSGIYTKNWAKEDPRQEWSAVGLNAIPAIIDWTQFMLVDLVP